MEKIFADSALYKGKGKTRTTRYTMTGTNDAFPVINAQDGPLQSLSYFDFRYREGRRLSKHWGIKTDAALDGEGRGKTRISSGVSSAAPRGSTLTANASMEVPLTNTIFYTAPDVNSAAAEHGSTGRSGTIAEAGGIRTEGGRQGQLQSVRLQANSGGAFGDDITPRLDAGLYGQENAASRKETAEVDGRSVLKGAADLVKATGGKLWNIKAAELFDQSDLLTTKKGIDYLTVDDSKLDCLITDLLSRQR